jgi:hypothetical protein
MVRQRCYCCWVFFSWWSGVLFGAFRIIIGWLLPVAAVERFDAFMSAMFALIFRLSIVGLAGIVVWVIWLAVKLP